MNKVELNVMELLEYLEEILENAPKVPITGKAMIDTKEFEEVIDAARTERPTTSGNEVSTNFLSRVDLAVVVAGLSVKRTHASRVYTATMHVA